MNNKPNQPKKQLQSYAKYSGIAFQMLAIIVIGSFAGVKLDEKFPNAYPLFTITLSLLSIAMAMYYVIKQVSKPTKRINE